LATATDPITALPAVRAPGQWPGQSGFSHIIALLYIITILAFASALFLISATMNTLIAEQAGEIAILKALGGRRRQIAGITVCTAAMLGAAGAVIGTILGIGIAYLLAGYFAVKLIDVSFGFAISVPVVVAGLVLGPALAVAASLPALRRALRRPVAETLAGAGASGFGSGWLDRAAARSGLLSGARVPGSVRMGVRNALRQKRRSAAVRQPCARRRRRHTRRHRSRAGREQFRAVQRADLHGLGPGHPPLLRLPAERGPLVHG
jgi:putative ABC transport system permease protein